MTILIRLLSNRLLHILCLLGLLSGVIWLNTISKPTLVNTSGQNFTTATVLEVVEDNLQEDGSRIGNQVVRIKYTSADGSEHNIEANSSNGYLFGAVCAPGDQVVAIIDKAGNEEVATIYGFSRALTIYGFIGIFLLSLVLVGGKKGLKSAIALFITIGAIFFLFFPLILRGLQPIVAALITVFISSLSTLYLLNGWSIKTMAASMGTLVGLLIAALMALVYGYFTNLSGYNVSNIESLLFVGQNTKIAVGGLLFAGILISSLGAILDVAMDIASALWELKQNQTQITFAELFKSGMHIGQDIMGTMATTLILAFLGSSLGTWVIDYVYNLPYLQVINSNNLGIEIMQGLAGGMGVIYTVPAVAFMAAWLLSKK